MTRFWVIEPKQDRGEMKPVAVIVNSDSLARICTHLGQPVGIPTLAPARDPPQSQFDFAT
jgi:hypothetical protein